MKHVKRRLLKDIIFCLWLGFEVIGVFLLAVIAGLWLDDYFNSRPLWIFGLLILAFIYVIKLLLGVGKDE